MQVPRSGRVPTEKQHHTLLSLASGSAGLSFTKRACEPFLRHGWVTAEWRDPYYQWVRITPDGLRALAAAIERYGLPEIGPKPKTKRRVCVSWARPPASDLRDTLTASPEQYTFRPKPEGYVTGAKPPAFCRWVFSWLGAIPGDDFTDLFPGSRAVSDAWAQFTAQERLVA